MSKQGSCNTLSVKTETETITLRNVVLYLGTVYVTVLPVKTKGGVGLIQNRGKERAVHGGN